MSTRLKFKCNAPIEGITNIPLPRARMVSLSNNSSEWFSCAELLAQDIMSSNINILCIEQLENQVLEARFESRAAELSEPKNRLRLVHYACTTTKQQTRDVCKRGFTEDHWQSGILGHGVSSRTQAPQSALSFVLSIFGFIEVSRCLCLMTKTINLICLNCRQKLLTPLLCEYLLRNFMLNRFAIELSSWVLLPELLTC
jgi:hypothetical protein